MKLYLVGAGPGDPELITLKGVKILQKAKVVLYDALVHTDILDFCTADCRTIFVGKRGHQASCDQSFINLLIVEMAQRYGEVVRIKGGDPFVFGRGGEEVIYAQQHGIETVVVPGLSSSYAVPSINHIPLTHRGLSESFWVLTGITKDHQLSADIALAAQSSATVVILMGMHKLNEIVEIYQNLGHFNTPISIIQNGSMPNERSVTGRIFNITHLAQQQNIASPAIIVIGEVVEALKNSEFGSVVKLDDIIEKK
jgi:uroporphyrin-III C-methyltransferase